MNTQIFALMLTGGAAVAPIASQNTPENRPAPADLYATASPTTSASAFYWGDFDADGLRDALALTLGGEPRLFQNLGDGTFLEVSRALGLPRTRDVTHAAWGDHDADGRLDLFLSSPSGASHLLRMTEDGTFADVTRAAGLPHPMAASRADWLDYDADGLPDLHASTPAGERLFHNDNGSLRAVAVELPASRAALAGGSQNSSAAESDDANETSTHGRGLDGQGDGDPGAGAPPSAPSPGGIDSDPFCAGSIEDQATGSCTQVSSFPTFGELYPLGPEFNIDASGNVGIGILPTARLDVDLGNNEIARFGRAGATSELQLTNGRLRSDNGRFQILGVNQNGTARAITFGQADEDYDMTIDVDGRVGIGTSTPGARLDVDGNLNVTGPVDVTGVISASRLASTTIGAAPFQVASSSKVIGLNADLLDGLDSSAFSQFGNRVDTNEIAPGAVTSAKLAPDLFLSGDLTVDINTLFVDASSNRVGIGTTSPGAKLDVNGSASVGNDLTVDDELDVGGRTTLADGNIIFTTNSGGAGFVEVQDGNGGPNVRISSNSANAGYGAITVFDANGVAQAGVQVNSSGDGLVWGDVKNFVADNPDDPNTRIWYASLEGPEAAAYVRGTATLIGGEATIELPRHFQNVSSEQDITVLVTPLSARSRGLAVVEKSRARIVVRERLAGSGTYDFDWEVKAVRRGFEDYQVVRDAAHADLALPVDLSSHDD